MASSGTAGGVGGAGGRGLSTSEGKAHSAALACIQVCRTLSEDLGVVYLLILSLFH